MNVEITIHKTAETIKKNTPVNTKVVLFGSWAKGNALPTSDIDIGILANTTIPLQTMARIKEEVELLPTLRSIDVVDLHAVSERFRKKILEYGKIL